MPNKRQLFLSHVAQTSEAPMMLEVERAEACYIYDASGRRYLDFDSGICVSNLGHCHPKVVAAVQEQVGKYMHTMVYGEHIQSPQVKLASLLAEVLPKGLNCSYFVNSGSEAVEGAIKLAKRHTGRYEIIAAANAYHGSTAGADSLMSNAYFTAAYKPGLPEVRFITFNEEKDLERITEQTACVIMETVQAESGVITPRNNYLQKVKKRCESVGALLVLDEIQVGMGRTGTMFAFEQYGLVPDILLLAKGLGGGMPIGAFIADRKVMEVLAYEPVLGHITTFGGHPVTCAAAMATLEVLTESKLIEVVKAKSKLIIDQLQDHPAVVEIRAAGLLIAVQLENHDKMMAAVKGIISKGILVDWFLFNDNSFRIAPPLIVEEAQITEATGLIKEAFGDL